jgi:hypothetical protein
VLMFSFVPIASCRCVQNREVNLGSLSDTIEAGISCNLTISLMYSSVSFDTISVIWNGMKWALLMSLSTTTQMESWPLGVFGTYNKVHGNLIQYPFWNTEGMERSRRFFMFAFYMLTYMALGHIFNNIWLHAAPPEFLLQILVHLGNSWMYGILGLVSFIQNIPSQLCIIWSDSSDISSSQQIIFREMEARVIDVVCFLHEFLLLEIIFLSDFNPISS